MDLLGGSDGISIPHLNEIEVYSTDEILKVFEKGEEKRTFGSTGVNKESSRSHVVFKLEMKREGRTGIMHLVDLAGSEGVSKTGAIGQRKK